MIGGSMVLVEYTFKGIRAMVKYTVRGVSSKGLSMSIVYPIEQAKMLI
jgi:hypothetical protein